MTPAATSTFANRRLDTLRINDKVTAYGFALGAPHIQSTVGSISARRDLPSRLQTDCSVNPGNSGGPMLSDTNNQVIGLITPGLANANNINFAAPIKEVLLICGRIISKLAAG